MRALKTVSTSSSGAMMFLIILLASVMDYAEADIDINPDLPFGDINLLVVSDVHSFVGGHPHEIDRNADYGDFYSFHEQLKSYCDDKEIDLWLLNNGDWLHGTGLAMDGNSTNLLPIIKSIPWDGMNMGNHEAMYSAVVQDMKQSLLPDFTGKYITSNVLWKETMEPYGDQYQLLTGHKSTILLFGFLYDMQSPSELLEVIPVQEALQQEWFREALAEKYDAIVVMAHMENDNPLIDLIYGEIRNHVDKYMPIQFITGHSHERLYAERMPNNKKDAYVRKIEPGGLFDTVGFVSLPIFSTAQSVPVEEIDNRFNYEFLNTSKTVLHDRLGLSEDQPLQIQKGEELSNMIKDTQKKLGLDQNVACPGKDYFRNISIHHENSLWKLWREHVVPSQIFEKDTDRLMIVSKNTFQYDLRGSGRRDAMTLDDVVAIAPYMERVIYVGNVPDWMIRRLNNTLNTFSAHSLIPDFVLAGNIDDVKTVEEYELYTHEVDVPAIKAKLEKYNYQDFVMHPTGKRDTIYWLDYVMAAYHCEGNDDNEFSIIPYFYDPNELEEEATDGTLSSQDDDEENEASEEGEDESNKWTLPPGGYAGYVPGHGETHKIPPTHYENYQPPEDDAKKNNHHHSTSDLKAKMAKRKKLQKAIFKGFALTFAGALLLVPVVCGVMQLTGRGRDDDDGIGFYDREEVKSLKRHRRRGHKGAPIEIENGLPLGEIEIT